MEDQQIPTTRMASDQPDPITALTRELVAQPHTRKTCFVDLGHSHSLVDSDGKEPAADESAGRVSVPADRPGSGSDRGAVVLGELAEPDPAGPFVGGSVHQRQRGRLEGGE